MVTDAVVDSFLAPCLRRAKPDRFRHVLPALAFAAALFFSIIAHGADCNALILAQVQAMPNGGQYAANRLAMIRLTAAINIQNGVLSVQAEDTSPNFCSGATYLVFLKTIGALNGRIPLTSATLDALLVRGQPDGRGIWGRWNANGPGTARLFYEAGLGRNFDDFERARPGDFMKIFWTQEVGRLERGHSVIFLGREMRDGVESVRFWSSNLHSGYGEKIVPRTKIAYAIFSRLEHPEALNRLPALSASDPYLSHLPTVRSSIPEARSMTGI